MVNILLHDRLMFFCVILIFNDTLTSIIYLVDKSLASFCTNEPSLDMLPCKVTVLRNGLINCLHFTLVWKVITEHTFGIVRTKISIINAIIFATVKFETQTHFKNFDQQVSL